MNVLCPRCQSPILLDHASEEAHCVECGSTFVRATDTASYVPDSAEHEVTHVSDEGQATAAGLTLLGDYEIIEKIARGGMGVVYKARQRGLNRTIALKVIRSERLTNAEDIARFHAEAEAAAQLDHPGVVPVFEVGEHNGQHFLSMAFVNGGSLADQLTDGPLPPTRAADLVKLTAEAVQYAHDRGVIHRDLKPRNILLDKDGQPRITDFGLAKNLLSESDLTVTGEVMGTPPYMSPEQAKGAETGPLSDVYSLGATLYCLLTGRPPFQSSAPLETIQHVIERDPVAPRVLNPAVPRDLETICLKCLEKEPSARYVTAADLAAELQRYVSGEAILARPIRRSAKVWRWFRRKPLAAGFLATAAALIAVLVVGGPVWAVRESRLRAEADASNRDADRAVNDSFTIISENRLLNEPGFQPLRRELLQSALEYYQEFVRRRAGDQRVQAELARTYGRLAIITKEIGGREESADYYEKSIATYNSLAAQRELSFEERRSLANCRADLGDVHRLLGQHRQSDNDFQLALAELRELAHEEQEVAYDLGVVLQEHAVLHYMSLGDYAAANAALEEAIPIVESLRQRNDSRGASNLLAALYFTLGNVRIHEGQPQAARDLLLKSINVREPVAAAYPHIASYQFLLARTEANYAVLLFRARENRDVDAAAHYLEDAVSILERLVDRNPDVAEYRTELAQALMRLAALESFDRDPTRAEPLYQRASDLLEQVVAMRPGEPRVQGMMAMLLTNLTVVESDLEKAQRLAQQSIELLRPLNAQYPETVVYRVGLAMAELQLGDVFVRRGQPTDARPWIESAVDRFRVETPANIEAMGGPEMLLEPFMRLSKLYNSLGMAEEMAGVLEESRARAQGDPIELFMVAISYAECAVLIGQGQPELTDAQSARRHACAQTAVDVLAEATDIGLWRPSLLLDTSGDWQAVLEDAELRERVARLDAQSAQNPDGQLRFMQQMAEMSRRYMQQYPLDIVFREGLVACQTVVGNLYADRGDLTAARTAYERAVQTALSLNDDPQLQSLLGDLYHDTGTTLYMLGDAHAALPYLQQALEIKESLAEADPMYPRDELALCVNYLGSVTRRTGDVEGARQYFQRAYDVYSEEVEKQPGDLIGVTNLSSACANLGRLELQVLRPAEAARWFQEAIDQLEPLERTGKLGAPHTGWLDEFRLYFKLCDLVEQVVADADVALAQSPEEAVYLLIHRAAVLARDGRRQEVVETADLLAGLTEEPAENYYQIARLYARCAEALSLNRYTETPQQQMYQKEYEDQSLEALRQAIDAGFHDYSEIRIQTDLIVIRSRPEYTELLKNK